MKKAGFGNAACPIARSVAAIGDVWSLLIIRDAICGVRRFGEFQKRLGLAKNILACRLKKLVSCEILELKPASDGSAYQEYVPTQRGLDLLTVVVALGQWGDSWLVEPGETCVMLQETATGLPVAKLEICGQRGNKLALRDMSPVSGARPERIEPAPAQPARQEREAGSAAFARAAAELVPAGLPG